MHLDNVWYVAFISISVLGLLYFVFTPRVFDWNSVAYFSAQAYFLPAYFGETSVPRHYLLLSDECYAIMVSLVGAVTVGAMVKDSLASVTVQQRHKSVAAVKRNGQGADYASFTLPLSVLLIGAFLVSLSMTGADFFIPSKSMMYESYSYPHLFWQMSSMLLAVVAYIERRWVPFCLAGLSLCFLVFIGNRSQFALAAMSIITYSLMRLGRRSFATHIRWVAIAAGFGVFVLAYKQVYLHIKAGAYDEVARKITSGDAIIDGLLESEGFGTQHLLNMVSQSGFRLDPWKHWPCVLLSELPLGFSYDQFGEQLQAALFPDMRYGMASNIWAEFLATGGVWSAMAGIFLFSMCVSAASLKCLRARGLALVFYFGWMPWVCFYIHRNDVSRMIAFFKQVVAVFLFCLVFNFVRRALSSSQWHLYESSQGRVGRA